MKSIKVEMNGWIGTMVHELSGETWSDVLDEYNKVQDIGCLLRQVYMMGTEADRAGVAPFEEFANKWFSGEVEKADFAACRIALSIGHICCLEATDEKGTIVFPAWGGKAGKSAKSKKMSEVKKAAPKKCKAKVTKASTKAKPKKSIKR